MHVSLAEALEVRGGPLQEEEVWAVLSQSAESLQELFHKDPAAMGFIISPWSLLLMPSGNISFTEEYVTQQDLRAFTAPEVLEGVTLTSVSDIEKMHMYSLGMTLFWGADYEIPQSQPMKLGEHLNSLLLNMCDDVTVSRMSLRTVLDICSKHIRNSSCDPPFSYIRKLVRLVMGSLSQLDGLLTDRESLPERSKEIRERLRGKGLPSGRSAAPRVLERYRARTQEQASLNRGLSRSMGSLPQDLIKAEEPNVAQYSQPDYRPSSGSPTELYSKAPSLQHQLSYPYLHPLHPHQKGRPVELDRRSLHFPNTDARASQSRKPWASSVDLAYIDPEALRFGALEDARRGSSALSTYSAGRHKSPLLASREFGLKSRKPHHHSALSVGSGVPSTYDRIKEQQRKLQLFRKGAEDPVHSHHRYYSDYSSSSESPSVTSSDPDYRQAKKPSEGRRFGSQLALASEHDALSLTSHPQRQYEGAADEGLVGAELLLQKQEEEVQRLQAQLAKRLSRADLYAVDDPLLMSQNSALDLRDPLYSNTALHKRKNFLGPEFVKMASDPSVTLTVPSSSSIMKRGKGEEIQRKVGVVLLNGQKLELSCDTKAVCKDVLDMVVAHIGLVEHHLFGLAYLKDNEFVFVDPDAKLTDVAPEGWKKDPKKKKSEVLFILFLRIKFFVDDVNLIQHAMTKHQYYLQLRKDILEERMCCDLENSMLLASLALQAEFGDYKPELYGKTYFRLEHYIPASVLDKLDQTTLKEELPKLHSSYYGASELEAEFEFLKVSQRLTEYGVHFHRVLPEKRSQTGILLGIYSKGVLIFEVLNGNRTPVLRFPWRETKKISFSKKKICLQNTSDGIKHLFQTDSNKSCQYLLQLCSDQHKFHLQMKARQNNQELQDLENSPLSSLQYAFDSQAGGAVGRTVSSGSLSTRSNPDHLKRISYSEVALNRALSGPLSVHEELHFPGFNPGPSSIRANPKLLSRSLHNLGQILDSSEHREMESNSEHGFQQHQRASSDTDSFLQQQHKPFSTVSHSSPAWSNRITKDSDTSSVEDLGQAYVVGVSMHSSSGQPSTPTSVNDSLKKKMSALPSPEREISAIHLKKDVKYGLGFQIVGGETSGRKDLGTIVSAVTPGGPADLHGCLKPGDRLISVNDVNVDGLSHAATVEFLQNAPDDVKLIVSQPKERLYKEPSSSHAPFQLKAPSNALESLHKLNPELDLSSEEQTRAGSQSPLLHSTGPASSASSPSHGSKTDSVFKVTPPADNAVQQYLDRAKMALTVSSIASHKPDPSISLDSAPPALPPKMRKAKVVEIPKEPSDCGDSDMDEETLSSQNQTMSKKGGINTSVRHGGIYVKAVIPKGAAELDGRIQKGDRVMAVNGKSLEGATHQQAVEALRDTGQKVLLLLEKGHPPAESVHAPVTPQYTPPTGQTNTQSREPQSKHDYGFVTDENMFAVTLLKNTSGLGFSFSREENVPGDPAGSSMVRVKKLFPGQPAAESGRINVGDVILQVNQTHLRGLSQHEVISALRGTGQEVTLLLCRPERGLLPEVDTALSPMSSPRKEPGSKADPSLLLSKLASSPGSKGRKTSVEDVLERLQRTPVRQNSYSDSTDGDEEIEEAFSPDRHAWDHSVYQTPSNSLAQGGLNNSSQLDDSAHSVFYSPNLSMTRLDLSKRYPSSPSPADLDSPEPMVSSPTAPSPDPLPPPLPQPLNLTMSANGQDANEFVPEVELNISLVKSEKGSLGFTLTKGNDHGCYIHDIVQDPAKGDGRLQPGDRMIMVNNTDVTNMGHTEVVNLVRAAPRVVDLVVGRILENPKPPIDAHMLPDICFKGAQQPLGLVLGGGSDSPYGVLFVKDILPGSLASEEGSLRPLDLIHYISGAPTQELTLSESRRLLELSFSDHIIKATRDGKPVYPGLKNVAFLNNNVTPKVSSGINGFLKTDASRETDFLAALSPIKEETQQIDLDKPSSGGLGFSVIGGERGIFVKSITPGGVAEASGKLQVGDRLLKVNDETMTGVSHTKAVTTIRKTKGLVRLIVSRPPEQNPHYSPDRANEATDLSDEYRGRSKSSPAPDRPKSTDYPELPPIDYHEDGSFDHKKELDQSTELSEDTDCDGSSLPEDSPKNFRNLGWQEESVDDPLDERFLSASHADEDEITWGSDELPIENMTSRDDGPLITEEELTSLPLVKVVPDGQYTGLKLSSIVRMMRGLLEQKVPLQEFENLQNLQPLDDCLIGQTKENKKKNRYKNIVPFDTTRVLLGKDGGYINANFINMPVNDEDFMYIACQGPLPTTLGDFWQMVWEQKSNVIAMMTQEVEGGKVKCQRYWPDTPCTAEMVDDRLQLTLIKDQHLDNFIIRLIEVKDIQTNEIQRVTHLNYTGWPDHGTPSQPEQLLTFISYMRHVHRSGPIITHCSAGIGRSGTLICIDVVLGLISKDADFDISDVVRNMRLQRQGMVQTEDQYIFCYQVILYVLRCLQAEEKISG